MKRNIILEHYDIGNKLEWIFPKEKCEYKQLCQLDKLANVEKIECFSAYCNQNPVQHVHFIRTANDIHCNII